MTRTEISNHLAVARLRLQEAGVPPSLLRPADLLAWEPEQWATLIKLARLTELPPSPGRIFREAYRRPHEVWP